MISVRSHLLRNTLRVSLYAQKHVQIKERRKYVFYFTDKQSYKDHRRKRTGERCESSYEKRRDLRLPWTQRGRQDYGNENACQPVEAHKRNHSDLWRSPHSTVL